MNDLAKYLETQLAAGYTKEKLTNYLRSQNYPDKIIDEAFSQLNSNTTSQTQQTIVPVQQTTLQNKTLQNQLYTYVLSNLQQGYQAQQLYDYLLRQGYKKKDVDQVFSQINTQYYQGQLPLTIQHKHKHQLGTSSVIKVGVMLVVVLFLIGGTWYFLQGNNSLNTDFKLLDIHIDDLSSFVLPGEPLRFSISLSNLGDPGLVDINFDYIILDSQEKQVYTEGSMKAFETTLGFTNEIIIPSDFKEGSYTLKVVANYGGQEAISHKPFVVGTENTSVEAIPVKPIPVLNESTIVVPSQTTSMADNFQQTVTTIQGDQENLNKALAEKNQTMAGDYCALVKDPLLQSQCYSYVANTAGDSNFCASILDAKRKEDCYLNFVLSGQTELCLVIKLPENKALCKSLTQFSYENAYLQSGDPTDLLTPLGKTLPNGTELPNINKSNQTLSDLNIGDFVS